MKRLIDVSRHNGVINWSKVKGNVDGAIIRVGYRGYSQSGVIAIDPQFKNNVKGCQDNDIPFGVYFFPCSISDVEAIQEADWIIKQVKGLHMSFPIYLDSEIAEVKYGSGRSDKLSSADRTKYLNVIIGRLEKEGYEAGVYASYDWFANHLNVNQLYDCSIWVAQWSSKCTYKGEFDAWQYTSGGSVPGINGRVDMSYYYKDISTGTTNPGTKKTTGQLAVEVIDGKWGTAPNRKLALTIAGYNYETVQARVNEIISAEKLIKNSQTKISEYQTSITSYEKKLDEEKNTLDGLYKKLEDLKQ